MDHDRQKNKQHFAYYYDTNLLEPVRSEYFLSLSLFERTTLSLSGEGCNAPLRFTFSTHTKSFPLAFRRRRIMWMPRESEGERGRFDAGERELWRRWDHRKRVRAQFKFSPSKDAAL